MVTLEPLTSWAGPLPEEIQSRIVGPRGSETEQFILTDAAQPVGYVAIDRTPNAVVLYEVWIRGEFRRRGLGTCALRLVAQNAHSRGLHSITVRPMPLDASIDRLSLIGWYLRLGFTVSPEDSDLLTGPASALREV